jgi:CRP/FNR family transcriptional regulator, cyclic AMP receptor protein
MLQPIETIKILQNHPDRSFKAGEVIFETGQTGDVMYGVIEGELEVHLIDKIIETIKPGDIFGVGALIHTDELRTTTVIAKTDCKLAYLDREHFMFAVQETPMFALEVMKSYSDRFRRLKEIVTL